jgi:acyl-CoA thioesterase-1
MIASRFGSALTRGVILAALLLAGWNPPAGGATSDGLYIALGDSIAAGIGSSLPRTRSYPAILEMLRTSQSGQALGVENLAIPGETAASFRSNGQLDRFRLSVDSAAQAGTRIDLVTVTLGGNEMLTLREADRAQRQTTLDAFALEYPAVLHDIRATLGPHTTIVVTTYYDLSEGDAGREGTDAWWIAQFNFVIMATAQQEQALIADLATAFDGRMRELTHYPYDVHPNNAGQRVIAETIWTALAVDTQRPTIAVRTPTDVTRPTPTIRFAASDDSGPPRVSISASGSGMMGPFDLGSGEYAVLLILGDAGGDASVTIVARDAAGNETELDLVVTYTPQTGAAR